MKIQGKLCSVALATGLVMKVLFMKHSTLLLSGNFLLSFIPLTTSMVSVPDKERY